MPKIKSKNYLIITFLLAAIFILIFYLETQTFPGFFSILGKFLNISYLLLIKIWWFSFDFIFIFLIFYGVWLAFYKDYQYRKDFIWLGIIFNILWSFLLTTSLFVELRTF